MASMASDTTSTRLLHCKDQSRNFTYPPDKAAKNLPSFCSLVLVSSLEAMAGTTVRAMIRLASREYAMVSPMSTNS